MEGQPVGSAATLYVQLDLTTRRMVKPWLGGNDQLDCELEPPLPLPGAIPTLEAPTTTLERVARYSDLDVNGHVNNTRYLDWFCDCFDTEYHRAWALKDVLIHYNREIRPEEQAELNLQTTNAESVLKGACDGALCFAIHAAWEKRMP